MKCSIYRCKAHAVTPLRAVDGVFWFCAHHAPIYEALSYKPLEEKR